jgi:hypothetical protein
VAHSSARYGLVDPDRVVAPYDLSLLQLTACQREAWGDRIAIALKDRFPAGTVLWFHAGELYRSAIAPVVVHQVRFPLAGLRTGEQLAWYHRQSLTTHTYQKCNKGGTDLCPTTKHDEQS